MISGVKEMILRCMQRMRGGLCATCDNRRACPAGRWQQAFPAGLVRRSGGGDFAQAVRSLLGLLARPAPAPICLRKQVEDAIESLMGREEVSVDRVAQALGLSRQTLYRRLKAEGTSFQNVLEAKRRQLAVRYLGIERNSVKTTAYRLGFSDPAAFSRAFKRWTGRSPGSFLETPSSDQAASSALA